MKIVKVEKDNCPACDNVGVFLDNQGISYDKVDVYKDPSIAMELGLMTVPIVVLKDKDGKIVDHAIGFNEEALSKIVEQVK